MNEQLIAAVRKERAKSPFMPMVTALAITRRTGAQERRGWEHIPGTVDSYRREQDGFYLVLKAETESEMPQDGDLGHYVDGVSSDYSYEWGGNYPMPTEEFPLRLPYTAFASGAYSRDSHAYPYFVPDGVEDWYENYREHGQSKSVAWDLTKEMVEQTIKDFFAGPLVYATVTITAHRKGVKLGASAIGTSFVGYDDDYMFEVADENGLIEEALDQAKETLVELADPPVPNETMQRSELWDLSATALRLLREKAEGESDRDVLTRLDQALDAFGRGERDGQLMNDQERADFEDRILAMQDRLSALGEQWAEVESMAQNVVANLAQVNDALGAEDVLGAVEDALANLRLMDMTSARSAVELSEDVTVVENDLDELRSEIASIPGAADVDPAELTNEITGRAWTVQIVDPNNSARCMTVILGAADRPAAEAKVAPLLMAYDMVIADAYESVGGDPEEVRP